MAYKKRENQSNSFRWAFAYLFLLSGLISLSTALLNHYTGINLLPIESNYELEAVYVILSVFGFMGVITASIMMYLLQERRDDFSERRMQRQPFNYANRRYKKSSAERRAPHPK